jgi:hypothetical protein
MPGDTVVSHMSVVSTAISVTVPAGTFNCYEYRTHLDVMNGLVLDHTDTHYYFAPGTGMVKRETILYASGARVIPVERWELVEVDKK